jgi:hypothetical protein
MDETIFAEQLTEAIEISIEADVQSFRATGVLSGNEGLVVRLADGSEFQVTIVQSR